LKEDESELDGSGRFRDRSRNIVPRNTQKYYLGSFVLLGAKTEED
jgi:hypothetical protein